MRESPWVVPGFQFRCSRVAYQRRRVGASIQSRVAALAVERSFSPEPTATVDFTVAVGSGLNESCICHPSVLDSPHGSVAQFTPPAKPTA
jgi:hypothetical protein